MIAKIKTGKFFKGALQYNLQKIQEGKAAPFYSRMFRQEHPTYSEMLQELRDIATQCPNVSEPVFHTSLNFAPEEHLSDEILQAVVDEYMDKLGYSNTPYVVFKHNDTAHQHVHILSVNIKKGQDGKYKKIKDNHIHRRSQAISRELEKKYGLIVATEREQKQKELARLIPELKEYGTVSTYQQLSEVVDFAIKNLHFKNLWELNSVLNNYNIACYKNKSRQGDEFYKFTFQNPNTRKNIGVSGTPTQLKLTFSSNDIDHIFAQNQQEKEKHSIQFSNIPEELFAEYVFIDQEDLDAYLRKQGLTKIRDGFYWHKKSKSVYPLRDLKIPEKFISKATLKREYFSNIAKSATEYRKLTGVFHESTMYSLPKYVKGFQNYFFTQESLLSTEQKELLFNSFIKYKLNNLDLIIEKEHQKDIAFCNKLYQYVAKLNLSMQTARLFLEKFNINNLGEDIIKVSNSVDRVVREVRKDELSIFNPSGRDHSSELKELKDNEWELIRCAVNGKYCRVDPEQIEWERVECFLPADYADKYTFNEEFDIEYNEQEDLSSGYSFRGILNSINEYEYMKKKKKKKRKRDT